MTPTPISDEHTGHCVCNATSEKDVTPRSVTVDLEQRLTQSEASAVVMQRLLLSCRHYLQSCDARIALDGTPWRIGLSNMVTTLLTFEASDTAGAAILERLDAAETALSLISIKIMASGYTLEELRRSIRHVLDGAEADQRQAVLDALASVQDATPEELRSKMGIDKQIRYEPDPDVPGGFIRILPSGERTAGKMEGRKFVPNPTVPLALAQGLRDALQFLDDYGCLKAKHTATDDTQRVCDEACAAFDAFTKGA